MGHFCLMGSGKSVKVEFIEEPEAISPEFLREAIHVGDPSYSRVALLQAWPLKCKSTEGGD